MSTPNYAPLPDKVADAFRLYIVAQAIPELAAFPLVSSLTTESYPVPGVVFSADEENIRERIYGRGIFDVPLSVHVGSDASLDPAAEAHQGAVGLILAHLNDKDALRAALNLPALDRPVADFHLYDYQLVGQPTRAVDHGIWETILRLLVICQGRDGN